MAKKEKATPAPETEAPAEVHEDAEKPQASKKLQEYVTAQEGKLKIDLDDLNGHFIDQAPNYLKAAINFHKAERQLQLEKQAYETCVAVKDAEIRASEVKTTEAFIDKAIKGDETVQTQKKRVIDAELQVGIHQAVMRSWDHKRDMLIQVGAVARAEMGGQLQLNKTSPEQERPKVKNGRATEL